MRGSWGEKERAGSLASGRIMICCLQGKHSHLVHFSQRTLKNLDHSWNEAPQRCSEAERRTGREMSSRGGETFPEILTRME